MGHEKGFMMDAVSLNTAIHLGFKPLIMVIMLSGIWLNCSIELLVETDHVSAVNCHQVMMSGSFNTCGSQFK